MRPTTRFAARLAAPALALVATLALAGCGGRMSGAAPTPPAATTPAVTAPSATAPAGTTGTPDPAAATATPPAGQVVDQDTLDRITGVLDDTGRVLDAVDQEIATDPQE